MKRLFLFLVLASCTVCSAQNRYEVLIREIMADPSPAVGLPNYEWLELHNTGSMPLNLQNWRIGDATGTSGPLPAYVLKPDSAVIVCGSSALTALSAFGPALSVTSFPSLDNDGDLLFLRAANGRVMHAVNYSSGWYRNEVKQDGGWSLEMIDTRNPCAGGENWIASVHPAGGTPGKANSVAGHLPDTQGPELVRAWCPDSSSAILLFTEPLDSANAVSAVHYRCEGATIQNIVCLPPLFSQVQLKFAAPLQPGTIYTLTATGVTDCRGNTLTGNGTTRAGLASDAAPGDIVINEVLFDPRPNAYDFVELYNRGAKTADAARLFIANRNSAGQVSTVKALSPVPFLVFPGDHIVATEEPASLYREYLVAKPGQVMPVNAMATFPDDEGTVVVLNYQGAVLDELHYRDDWHFALLADPEGVSLERIHADGITQDPGNWHSAASTAGYATPTSRNSQQRTSSDPDADFSLAPALFSPDNDGRDDVVVFAYRLEAPGYVANITIFDATGRPVRRLVRNGTLGLSGSWTWNGLDEKEGILPAGTYVVLAEFFHPTGQKKAWKKALVLARYLH